MISGIRTRNHLGCKRILNHLANLTIWLIDLCCDYLSLWCIWLFVNRLVVSRSWHYNFTRANFQNFLEILVSIKVLNNALNTIDHVISSVIIVFLIIAKYNYFNKVSSTDNFLSPIFSPYLSSKMMLLYVNILFFGMFLFVFYQKSYVFIIFIFFLVPNFCNRVLINQKMELVIRNCQCDKWPKLYDKWPFVTCTLLLTHSNIPKIYQLTRWRYTFIFESLASKNKAKFIFRLTMNFRDFLFLNHSFKGHAWACFLV